MGNALDQQVRFDIPINEVSTNCETSHFQRKLPDVVLQLGTRSRFDVVRGAIVNGQRLGLPHGSEVRWAPNHHAVVIDFGKLGAVEWSPMKVEFTYMHCVSDMPEITEQQLFYSVLLAERNRLM